MCVRTLHKRAVDVWWGPCIPTSLSLKLPPPRSRSDAYYMLQVSLFEFDEKSVAATLCVRGTCTPIQRPAFSIHPPALSVAASGTPVITAAAAVVRGSWRDGRWMRTREKTAARRPPPQGWVRPRGGRQRGRGLGGQREEKIERDRALMLLQAEC